MKRYLMPLILIMLIALLGCLPSFGMPEKTTKVVKTDQVYPAKSLTKVISSTIFPTVTQRMVEPEATSTSTKQPETIINTQCLKIAPGILTGAKPNGTLALGCFGYRCISYLFSFDQGVIHNLPINDNCVSVSPGGKLLPCEESTNDPLLYSLLVFYSSDGKIMNKFSIQKDWFVSQWLNKDYFTVSLIRDPNEVPPTLLLNPYTGEQKLLLSNFPGLKPYAGSMGSPFHFGSRSVVYDPTLKLVVYPQTTEDNRNFIVLWDLQAQKALAKVEDLGDFLNHPIWSDDGKKFVVSVATKWNPNEDNLIDEVFSISRDGQIQQITHFGNLYSNIRIEMDSLSPDGKFLTIWVTYDHPGPDQKYRLLVINLETQEVIDYCLPPHSGAGTAWSLDNRYLAIGDWNKQGEVVQTLLVDTQTKLAVEVSKLGYPIGWMIGP